MSRIFLITCIFFAFLTAAYAGGIYTYTDKDGNTVITNEPIPEKYENKAKEIDSFERDSSEEIQKREDETRQKQEINRAKEDAQKQRYQQQTQQQEEKAGLKCYTKQDPDRVGGGIVSPKGIPLGGVVLPGPGATWYICKDKNGKIVSKKRL
jgi:hypothetical protein